MTEPHLNRLRGVLVVDDDPQVRGLLASGLVLHDFAVWDAPGGAEAVELLRQHLGEIDAARCSVAMVGVASTVPGRHRLPRAGVGSTR